MKNFNEKPQIKSSFTYFQIGLILALLTVIFFIEQTTIAAKPVKHTLESEKILEEKVFHVSIEKPKPKPLPVPEVPKKEPARDTEDFKLVDDHSDEEEPSRKETAVNSEPTLKPEDLLDEPSDEPIAPVGINFVEEAPIYPGCEIYESKEDRTNCLSSKIGALVKRKFDGNLASRLGLSGQQRIYVTFTIDTDGKVVDIKANSASKDLANEAERVANMLPDMKPGKQQDRNVPVSYTLPIIFNVN